MDLYLISDTPSECKGAENDSDVVESTADRNGDSDTTVIFKRYRFRAVFTLDPIPDGNDSILVWDNSFPARVNELLLSNRELPESLAAYLTMASLKTTAGYLKSLSLIEDAASEEINIFEQIFLSALPDPTSFQFTLAIEHPPDQVQFTGNNLKVAKLPNDSYELEMWMDIPEKLGLNWRDIGRMTNGLIIGLTLNLDDAAVCAVYLGKMALLKLLRNKFNFARRIFVRWSDMLLNGDMGSDVAIRVGDKAIKLSERSPVLKALLKKKKDNYGDIFGEMTEVGVQALVNFICSWDLGQAWKSCDIALELLKAGIQLKMEDLTDAMEQLMCFMPFNWFSFEMATALQRLIYLIRALSNGDRLRKVEKKCLDFWQWYSINIRKEVSSSSWGVGPQPIVWDETSSNVKWLMVNNRVLSFRESPIINEFSSRFQVNLIPGDFIEKKRNIFWTNLLLGQVDKVDLDGNLKVCLKFGEQRNAGSVKVSIDEDKLSVNIFEELAKLPPNCYGFNLVILEDWYPGASAMRELKIDEKNLKVEKFEDGKIGLELTGIDVGKIENGGLKYRLFFAQVSLTLVLNEGIGNALNWMEFVKHRFNKWSGMLKNGFGIPTDLVIRAGESGTNGEGFKCHKFVLSESSPVFKVMLEVDMMEGRNGCVEIGDMTEAGVKAMLRFVYGRDLGGAWSDCGVALELLEAGHKYEMEDLVEAMMEVVGAMPFEWFRRDVVEEMVGFVGMVEGKLEKVREKCLAVLKWFDDMKTDTSMEVEAND